MFNAAGLLAFTETEVSYKQVSTITERVTEHIQHRRRRDSRASGKGSASRWVIPKNSGKSVDLPCALSEEQWQLP